MESNQCHDWLWDCQCSDYWEGTRRNFLNDGDVLYLDWCLSNTDTCNCQNTINDHLRFIYSIAYKFYPESSKRRVKDIEL